MNGVGKKAHKYPVIFFDAESLFIGGRFEMDYDQFFPNIRFLMIRAEKDFRYENFSKLEKVYFISFTFSELMKTNVLNKSQIDVYMLFIYSIDYQFELIGNLNLNHIRSLNLCFPTRNESEINTYINEMRNIEGFLQQNKNKVKVTTFYR